MANEKKKKQKLTAKQELFCQEYLVDLNGTQAAIRAGYSEKTANRIANENLSKPYLADRLAELKKTRAEKVSISQEDVLNNLIQAMNISLGKEETHVQANVEGVTTSVAIKKTDVAAFLKANDMLAKHIGLYETHNEQLSSNVTQNFVDYSKLSADELKELKKMQEKASNNDV